MKGIIEEYLGTIDPEYVVLKSSSNQLTFYGIEITIIFLVILKEGDDYTFLLDAFCTQSWGGVYWDKPFSGYSMHNYTREIKEQLMTIVNDYFIDRNLSSIYLLFKRSLTSQVLYLLEGSNLHLANMNLYQYAANKHFYYKYLLKLEENALAELYEREALL